MKQPEYILDNGTKIKTRTALESDGGMMISAPHLAARRPNAEGEIAGVVGGHGGDVYWVRHGQEEWLAAYCFTEFDLA